MSELPPGRRSAAGKQLSHHAIAGELVLQQCQSCQAVQYPPREVCGLCLSESLAWQQQQNEGQVLASSALHNSLEPCFSEALPWTLVSVQLDCGPVVLAQLSGEPAGNGRVRVRFQQQTGGSWILQAAPESSEAS